MKLRPLYYDRQANPISDDEYIQRMKERATYGRVAEDHVEDVRISTVWLGLDHGYGNGPPIIFETMVFGLDTDCDPQWRYSTEDEATAGHWAAVKWVQDMQRRSHGQREDLVLPDDSQRVADIEPGSVDISGLDKAELLAALCNATAAGPFAQHVTHEEAAALIQDRLGQGHGEFRNQPVFDFDYVAGRPIKCDISGPRVSAFHVARYDRDAGQGTMAHVVAQLRAALDRRRAEREAREP